MSYSAEQIERQALKRHKIVVGSCKYHKKCQHRRLRRKMRADLEFVPQYNRYDGGWVL